MACCSERPARYLNQRVSELEDLAPLLESRGGAGPGYARAYICRVCGQKWFEDWSPAMHSDIPVVCKEGASPDPLRDENGSRPAWVAPPAVEPPTRGATQSAPFVICILIGLLTLPQGDLATRQNWFVGWMALGMVLWFLFPREGKPSS